MQIQSQHTKKIIIKQTCYVILIIKHHQKPNNHANITEDVT